MSRSIELRVWTSALAAIVLISIGSAATAADNIRGTVMGPDGGEAGVWVIAETGGLATSYRKIVVTDDEGRFLLPDLPDASYSIWARGYGLLDTSRQTATPGSEVQIKAQVAAFPKQAAEVYPANYWYSLLEVPEAGQFPGGGAEGNGISQQMSHQAQFVDRLKDGCQLCHQMGNKATREIPNPNDYDSTRHAWDQRMQMGNGSMTVPMSRFGREKALDVFADWTDRINAGEVPEAPPRPEGIEQNLVLTQWGWSNDEGFVHDNVSTDKRNPTLYPNGRVFGVAQTQGLLTITDPQAHESRELVIPMREQGDRSVSYVGGMPSNPHNPMMDDKNRVWMTSSIRPNENPDWCKDSDHPSVKRFPIERSGRQLSYFDATSEKFALVDTCYGTHHLQFAADDVLWSSGDGAVVGWLDTRKLDETGDEAASQGWCPTILDTNGDGKVSEYVNPGEPADASKDTRVFGFAYGIIPNPADGSVWFTRPYPDTVPGQILRLDPKTCMTEQYQPPFETDAVPPSGWGHGPRGIDIDKNGILWTALGGSGHIASFDRSKCKVLNGPAATGQHCPEGWTLHATPGPQMKGVAAAGSADFHYYIWVDQFDTLGLGEDVAIANGTTSDALLAWVPEEEKMLTLRVPYPLGFYTRGLDGRIDDPKAGWKGRGVWASNNSVVPWHNEGGRGMTSDIVRFQIRPNPLAE